MYYRLLFKNQTALKYLLRNILLICGLLLDISAILAIVLICFGDFIFFTLLFASLVFGILFRYVALRLIYSIECRLQGDKLIISKVYMHKMKVVFEEKLADIKVLTYSEYEDKIKLENSQNNEKILNLMTEEEERYYLTNGKISVLCNLDKYIYATLLKGEVL